MSLGVQNLRNNWRLALLGGNSELVVKWYLDKSVRLACVCKPYFRIHFSGFELEIM